MDCELPQLIFKMLKPLCATVRHCYVNYYSLRKVFSVNFVAAFGGLNYDLCILKLTI